MSKRGVAEGYEEDARQYQWGRQSPEESGQSMALVNSSATAGPTTSSFNCREMEGKKEVARGEGERGTPERDTRFSK